MNLPEHLTIIEAAEMKEQFAEALNNGPQLEMDLSRLQRVDTAGIQLLAAVKKAAQQQGGDIQWRGSSDALFQSARWIGMVEVLGLPE